MHPLSKLSTAVAPIALVGCILTPAAALAGEVEPNEADVTFTKDVLPILQRS